jgi:hypothetical protein
MCCLVKAIAQISSRISNSVGGKLFRRHFFHRECRRVKRTRGPALWQDKNREHFVRSRVFVTATDHLQGTDGRLININPIVRRQEIEVYSDYFPKQSDVTGYCNGDAVCFLWARNWIFCTVNQKKVMLLRLNILNSKNSFGGVRLSPLVTSATIWSIV